MTDLKEIELPHTNMRYASLAQGLRDIVSRTDDAMMNIITFTSGFIDHPDGTHSEKSFSLMEGRMAVYREFKGEIFELLNNGQALGPAEYSAAFMKEFSKPMADFKGPELSEKKFMLADQQHIVPGTVMYLPSLLRGFISKIERDFANEVSVQEKIEISRQQQRIIHDMGKVDLDAGAPPPIPDAPETPPKIAQGLANAFCELSEDRLEEIESAMEREFDEPDTAHDINETEMRQGMQDALIYLRQTVLPALSKPCVPTKFDTFLGPDDAPGTPPAP